MDHLWSPWRMKYVQQNERTDECVFCRAARLNDGLENLVVHRGQSVFVILNRFPYTTGHIMVVPYAHESSYELLTPETRGEIMELINQSTVILRQVYRPEGFNIGANLGAVAGAGIAEHVHFHIVPRWSGDVNFMTAVGGVRVMPEELEDTWKRLRGMWG